MIYFWLYVLGWLLVFPKVARWFLEDVRRTSSRREASTGDYVFSFCMGAAGGVFWPGFVVVFGIKWFIMNIAGPIVFPELREKNTFWKRFKRKVKNG